MILRGRSSGARARVTNVRLIPDVNGTLIGTFHVPDSSSSKLTQFLKQEHQHLD